MRYFMSLSLLLCLVSTAANAAGYGWYKPMFSGTAKCVKYYSDDDVEDAPEEKCTEGFTFLRYKPALSGKYQCAKFAVMGTCLRGRGNYDECVFIRWANPQDCE